MDEQSRKTRRIIITGGRQTELSYDFVCNTIEKVIINQGWFIEDIIIVHGGAKGIDALAGQVARKIYKEEEVKADWDNHGRAAGPIRNQAMINKGADFAIVFPGGVGTQDMMTRLFKAGIPFSYAGYDK